MLKPMSLLVPATAAAGTPALEGGQPNARRLGFGQKGAYYTGSSAGAHDSRNVRDGHYALWSRMTFVAAVDVGGVPTNPDVA